MFMSFPVFPYRFIFFQKHEEEYPKTSGVFGLPKTHLASLFTQFSQNLPFSSLIHVI